MDLSPGAAVILPAAFAKCWQLTPTERKKLTALFKRDGLTTRSGAWPLEVAVRQLQAIRRSAP